MRNKMHTTKRKLETALLRATTDFLGIAHDAAGFWRGCARKVCLRTQTCHGNVDSCGAHRFLEGWTWVQSLCFGLRDGQRPRAAMRGADRQVIANEAAGDFGRQPEEQPRTVTIHYPGLGESFEMTVIGKRGRRATPPARRPGGAPSEGKGRRRQNALPGPLAPNLEVGHSRGRADKAILRRS